MGSGVETGERGRLERRLRARAVEEPQQSESLRRLEGARLRDFGGLAGHATAAIIRSTASSSEDRGQP